MREHQIIINLKPEHFEQVQRMARAAGSKSIGMYVRQKLLSTLGLADASKPKDGQQLDSSELKLLTAELRRLHRELQIFLADSTPTISPESIPPFPRAVAENFLAEGAPLLPESEPTDDAITPSLGHLPYTTPMPPPDEIHSFAEVDELENLADRAFAISPRLGALDEPQPKPFPDPLKELLNDAFLNSQNEDEEELEEAQPEAEADRGGQEELEEEVEEDLVQEKLAEEELVQEEIEEELAEQALAEEEVADQGNEEEMEETEEMENIEDEGESEDIDEDPDSEGDEPPTPPTPPPTPPVISGGPPPRKRNT